MRGASGPRSGLGKRAPDAEDKSTTISAGPHGYSRVHAVLRGEGIRCSINLDEGRRAESVSEDAVLRSRGAEKAL